MDLIYASQNREDIGVLKDFTLDLAFGSDENDFSASVSQNNHVADAGFYLYIQGTEYGGIIDSVTSDTGAGEVTYAGRTWHGILNSKILAPDAGQDYLTVSGDANAVLADLITRMGLAALFQADSTASDINIRNYQFPRYVAGYDGIAKMLSSVGAKLHMEYNGHNVVISAVPIIDYAKTGVDNDQTALTVKKVKNTVNHLICLGSGELKNRMVVHLYADESENISRNQTLLGVDEYAATYDYSLADSEEELVKGGMERFRQLLQQNTLNVDFQESDDIYDIGDIVGATDHITGISIAVPITKKIVKIEGDYVTVDVETDTQSAKAQISGTGTGYETPVKSVNGKTGNVELNAADVGALPTSGGTVTGDATFSGNLLATDVRLHDITITNKSEFRGQQYNSSWINFMSDLIGIYWQNSYAGLMSTDTEKWQIRPYDQTYFRFPAMNGVGSANPWKARIQFHEAYHDRAKTDAYWYYPWLSGKDRTEVGYGATAQAGIFHHENEPNDAGLYIGMSWDGANAGTFYYFGRNGTFRAPQISGAVYNDYAEFRQTEEVQAGRCVVETKSGIMAESTSRMQPGACIVSDTFGFVMGETKKCKTPIAVSGRVLAYPHEPIEDFRGAIGRPVCSAPDGTVSIMTDEEYQAKGYCAIGIISEIPAYDTWGSGNVEVDGRVWIKVF